MSDELATKALRDGLLRVDNDGSVWRIATRGRSGRQRPCKPARADRLDSTGYRRVRLGRRGSAVAHRIVWIALRGPIPAGLEINHKNLDKGDNRIDNLEIVTHAGNVQHAFASGAVPPVLGEANGQSKLTRDVVLEIRRRVSAGDPKRAVARDVGVTPAAIRKIVRGATWRGVTVTDQETR